LENKNIIGADKMALKEFKNVSVGYIPDTEIELNKKKYKIHDVINGEDILVDTDKNYPTLSKVLKPSKDRFYDGCPYQAECGGCQFQHVSYEYEKMLKEKYLNDLFKPFDLPYIKLVSWDSPLHYRNKCQMTYKLSKTKKVVCGLYEEYSHKIVTISNCLLQANEANHVIEALNKVLTKNKIRPYDEKTREGNLRHVYIRYGFNSKEIMVVLVTNGEMFPGRNNVVTDLKKLNLGITTIVQNYNSRDTSIVLGDKEKVIYGPGYFYEFVGGYKFKISGTSFFQINTIGMEKLYNLALEKAEIKNTDFVIDAYCGVGTISIFASKYAKKVIGVELNKNAIQDAKINAKINNITNVDFIADDATNYMTHLAKDRVKCDVVLMDPPRDRSTKAFINAINYLGARKVVYVSCNAETLKRDLYLFSENDYVVKSITAVDMFPRTLHTECVAVLEKDSELESLEKLSKISKNGGNVLDELNKKNKNNSNKMRVIPKADIEMMREEQYERTGKISSKKYKKY
jgi:23S rRNA (uracil1939-C5)-methyltransferase